MIKMTHAMLASCAIMPLAHAAPDVAAATLDAPLRAQIEKTIYENTPGYFSYKTPTDWEQFFWDTKGHTGAYEDQKIAEKHSQQATRSLQTLMKEREALQVQEKVDEAALAKNFLLLCSVSHVAKINMLNVESGVENSMREFMSYHRGELQKGRETTHQEATTKVNEKYTELCSDAPAKKLSQVETKQKSDNKTLKQALKKQRQNDRSAFWDQWKKEGEEKLATLEATWKKENQNDKDGLAKYYDERQKNLTEAVGFENELEKDKDNVLAKLQEKYQKPSDEEALAAAMLTYLRS